MTHISYSESCPEVVSALCRTRPLLRLKNVGMNCGCEYTSFPIFRQLEPYSRFEHSVGVSLIIWHHTRDAVQTVAGLLHDISTPAFAHSIDFMRRDYMAQESTEDLTEAFITGSQEIVEVLKRFGIPVDAVTDYHRYPVADNDSPKLSADRLEYTLGNMVNYRFASTQQAQQLYDDLFVGQNELSETELVFRHAEQARAFADLSLECSKVYCGDADRYAMQILSEVVKLAIDNKVLCVDDLYQDEPAVISKIRADEACREHWEQFRRLETMVYPPSATPTSRIVDAKRRCIDPYIAGQGRVSVVFPEYNSALQAFRNKALHYLIDATRH